jgi:O-antigen biosynthesis protein WbqV
LSGLVPNRDIQVVFSGVRPGEKLQEELVCVGEVAEPSAVAGILEVQPVPLPEHQALLAQLAALEQSASRNDAPVVLRQLRVIVSDYQHDAATNPHSMPVAA